MDWRIDCVEEIAKHRCFVSAMHKKRFIEMFEMVQNEPFFTKELAKCVFLAAWEQPYTSEMEGIFRKMTEENEPNTDRLGEFRKFRSITPNEKEIHNLAQEFLRNPGETPDESCLIRLSKAWIPLGDCALEVSEIIDSL